jgi:hypothetical protein
MGGKLIENHGLGSLRQRRRNEFSDDWGASYPKEEFRIGCVWQFFPGDEDEVEQASQCN